MSVTQPVVVDDESPRRRIIRRIVTTIAILGCFVGLALAAQHTQRADKDQPSITGTPHTIVELQAPAPGSSVLSQAQLLIDLTSDYDARFVVNGILIPDDQLQKRPELNQVLFTPGPGKVIEKWAAPSDCVDADIFRIDGTPEDIPAVHWCFNVT